MEVVDTVMLGERVREDAAATALVTAGPGPGPGRPLPDDGVLGDDERTEADRSPLMQTEAAADGGGGGGPPDLAALSPAEDAEDGDGTMGPDCGEEDCSANNSLNGHHHREGGCHHHRDKKKHRRGKTKGGQRHRQGHTWKPYNKLTWEERKELEDRETRRAYQKREERFASGQPMAPYNTTQFLMEQHQPSDPALMLQQTDIKASRPPGPTGGSGQQQGDGNGSGSMDSSEEFYDSPEDEDIFLAKEFAESYENCHAERLQNMSKDELVSEYLELEGKVERMEKQLKNKTSQQEEENGKNVTTERLPSEESIDIRQATNLEQEIKKLRAENEELKRENDTLRSDKTVMELGSS